MKSLKVKFVLGAFAMASLYVSVMLFVAWGFMHLWNWIAPDVFAWGMISFLQSLAILFILKLAGRIVRGKRHHKRRWEHRCREYSSKVWGCPKEVG